VLKLLGALLLAGGGLALGLGAAEERSRRAAALGSWRSALALLSAELAFCLPPMGELLENTARRAQEPAKTALLAAARGLERLGEMPFETVWGEALQTCVPPLAPEDIELLAPLGSVLGRYDGESQRRAVEEVGAALEAREGQVRAELRQGGKAWAAAGLSLGLFAAILLL